MTEGKQIIHSIAFHCTRINILVNIQLNKVYFVCSFNDSDDNLTFDSLECLDAPRYKIIIKV